MTRHSLDDQTTERLLAGALEPEDAPPGYAGVAALLRSVRGAPTADELGRREAVLSAMVATVGTEAPAEVASVPKEKRMIGKLVSLKALALAIPALALTATSAAAATGNLPAPAQSAIHGALAHVGVSVPSGSDTSGTATGPNPTGSAKFGLCNAYAASAGHPSSHSVAFANLENAAKEAGQSIDKFCTGVLPDNGTAVTGSRSNDTTEPDTAHGDHGPAGPPDSTPGSNHTSISTPAGPPTSTPAGRPTSTPAGRP